MATEYQRIAALAARLEVTGHHKILARGFTITRKGEHIITGSDQVSAGERIVTETAEGRIESDVVEKDH